MSEATKDELGGRLALRYIDRVVVKGRSSSIKVYELLSERSPNEETSAFLLDWEGAMKSYDEGRWAEASRRFSALLELRPTDGPAKVLRDRCADFEADPPGEDWDGVVTMKEK